MIPPTIIVMGVSGCGKSVVGSRLAACIGAVFEDADDFHAPEAKAKMSAGIPLTDEDRRPWYARLRAQIEKHRVASSPYVLACSALKPLHRDWLRAEDSREQIRFVLLDGSFELIRDRMASRTGHFMPLSLLESQFATLVVTPDLLRVTVDAEVDAIVEDILTQLRA